jgi:hypothetical protein
VMRYFEEKLAENLKRINEALKSGGFMPSSTASGFTRSTALCGLTLAGQQCFLI